MSKQVGHSNEFETFLLLVLCFKIIHTLTKHACAREFVYIDYIYINTYRQSHTQIAYTHTHTCKYAFHYALGNVIAGDFWRWQFFAAS